MARQPRLTIAGYPHHVILRGNNRQDIFVDDADRRLMLELVHEHSRRSEVAVHAYVLMDNHLHLLVTPASSTGVPAMMQAIGRAYVQRFNRRHGRSGTLWEGRYRSNLIQTDRYLLACMTYIELNPVRAGMVEGAADYAWSSHRHHAGIRQDPLVTPHALYWGLGNTPFAREAAYRELVAAGVDSVTGRTLADSAMKGWAIGQADFMEEVARLGGRRPEKQRPGRPRRPVADH